MIRPRSPRNSTSNWPQPGSRSCERPLTPYEGHQFGDYALMLHGKPVAVVEAKRTSKDAALGKEQALTYAKNLQAIHGGDIPFVLYTTGHTRPTCENRISTRR